MLNSILYSFVPRSLQHILLKSKLWKNNALIFREIKFFPLLFVFSLVFPALAAVFEGVGVGFLLGFLQNLLDPGGEPFRTGLSWFDKAILGIDTDQTSRLLRISGLVLCSTWIRGLLSFWAELFQRKSQMALVNRLYKRVFEQLQSLDLKFFSQTKAGEILNTMTAEVNQLQNAISALNALFSRGVVVLVYLVISFLISWQLSLISFLLFSLVSAALVNLNRRIRETSFLVSKSRGQLTSRASEFIAGIRTVKAFSTQDFERQRFYGASDQFSDASVEIYRRNAIVRPLADALGSTILIAMILVGTLALVPAQTLEMSALFTFLFVLLRMVPAIQQLNGSLAVMSLLRGSVDNIQALLRTEDKSYLENGTKLFSGLTSGIKINSIDFGYEPTELNLKQVTVTIPKGSNVALVGASGAGKSTLADLIVRFYDPLTGVILFDDVDLKDYDIFSIRSCIAMVSQETFIFNATVRDNIAYGLPERTDEEVFQASRLANAEEFILDLPEGFGTVLGDRGVRLSGGQRQRIAIARALLREPDILILDEATSALDSVSEKLIQESIDVLSQGRTVITIAHRLSTIENADKVIVMDSGEIIEQGTYHELLSRKGKLWEYHKMQNHVASKPVPMA